MTTLATLLAATDAESGTTVLMIGVTVLILLFWYLATERLKRKRNIGTIVVATITICSFFAIISPGNLGKVLSGKMTFSQANNLNGGIEIVGGTSVILEVKPNIDPDTFEELPITPEAMDSAKTILEKRINSRGTLDARVNIVGRRLEIQIPKLSPEEADQLISLLTTSAKLTIHSVHRQSRQFADDVASGEASQPGFKALPHTEIDKETKEAIVTNVLIKRKEALTGKSVKAAYVNPRDFSIVNIELTGQGGDKMEEFTSTLTQNKDMIATVLDGKVVNYATLNAETLGKNFVITGLDSKKEADDLCKALQNPLENDIEVMEQRSISASLGEATVKQGINAGIVGLGLTILFILLYYRFAGIIALIGLVVNIIILFGAMAAFGASFTLPGIAGIILTIGVAVDANVLIYERMREELARGKSVRNAIGAAYEKAFVAIFDANVTTLITAVILFWQASGSVKGFAVTLTIGILGTLLASLLCTRVLFWWSADLGILKKIKFMDLVPKRVIDFLSKRKYAFILSGIMIVGGLTFVGVEGKGNLGIDFTGGNITRFSVPAGQEVDQAKLNEIIASVKPSKNATLQIEEPAGSDKIISIKSDPADTQKIIDKIRDTIPSYNDKEEYVDGNGDTQTRFIVQANSESVSASMGGEFLMNAIYALGFGLIAVMIYITVRFEFSFAVGAFFALLHDIFICLGVLFMVGDELALIHIGAFLTIAGYSINDTIVVFDRIRESLQTQRGEVKDVMNQAINATLSRTILTSVTTFMAVLVLFIFGGQALSDFSLTIMIGVVVGTYSSIFIASPIVYLFSKSRGINLRRELLDANLEAEINPAGGN
ncbi:MAG: SecD/SecF fusion protein [Cryomorphaceae bacterium]|jgi:SecD/SecF fusion protein